MVILVVTKFGNGDIELVFGFCIFLVRENVKSGYLIGINYGVYYIFKR